VELVQLVELVKLVLSTMVLLHPLTCSRDVDADVEHGGAAPRLDVFA
jgi:hypothetical protein